jgi:hypothetical protein
VHDSVLAHPASWPMYTRALSLCVNRPNREADHSSSSSAEVNRGRTSVERLSVESVSENISLPHVLNLHIYNIFGSTLEFFADPNAKIEIYVSEYIAYYVTAYVHQSNDNIGITSNLT